MEHVLYCPYHHKDEKLRLPDNQYWEGEVKCSPSPGETAQTLKVTVIRGMLVDARPVGGSHH